MSIDVETQHLRRFAERIDANCDYALEEMAAYTRAHCLDFDGLDGALHPTRPALQAVADAMLDLITAAERGLRQTATDLRRSADDYDRSDWTAAETQWSVAPTWTTPHGWQETDRTGSSIGGAGGAVVTLMAPTYKPEVDEVKQALKSLFGTVNDVIAKFTGYDILATLTPVLLGDWAALKRIAYAWGELEDAWRAIAADISDGMDLLSQHWDSNSTTGLGGASEAFDFHIRSRWMRAFEALAQQADTMQQMCESMAAHYEHTVKGLLYVVNFYLARLKKGIEKIFVATNYAKLAMAVHGVVSSLYDLVLDGMTLAVAQVQMFIEGFEMMSAAFVMMRHQMNGDFDALKAR
jgi:hypothetical protein